MVGLEGPSADASQLPPAASARLALLMPTNRRTPNPRIRTNAIAFTRIFHPFAPAWVADIYGT
jgi:hypothetical protein